jgi:hypothetical protein
VFYDEQLHDLNSSTNEIRRAKSKRIKAADHVVRMGEKGNAYRIFVVKPERKKPLVELSHSR